MVAKPAILTGTMIKKYCQRCSGRTTEICNEIYNFLITNFTGLNQSIVVVVTNHRMIEEYFNILRLEFEKHPQIQFNHIDRTITDPFSQHTVKFIIPDSSADVKVKGLKFREIYFDTPELDIFTNRFMFELLETIR